ncbi:MAG: sigma-70 family RNA polymerase sigma factor [Gemmataceae bacterium]|nr:sigma-70 family RNA polymerase sigma factor [Gemmataceae bacterium]
MNNKSHPSRLDRISTSWSLLAQAKTGAGDAATAARCLLVERYRGAVRRYLGALLRNDEEADDLTQEFGLALIEGKLAKADRERGRFRDYVKTVVVHLVSRHRKKQKRLPRQSEGTSQATAPTARESEQAFLQSWRDELLARTWEALAQAHADFFTVLHFRAAHPDLAVDEMSRALTPQLGKKLTAESLRQTLHRARKMFADLLLDEVAQSLTNPTHEAIEQELSDLNLLGYCRPILQQKERRPAPKS